MSVTNSEKNCLMSFTCGMTSYKKHSTPAGGCCGWYPETTVQLDSRIRGNDEEQEFPLVFFIHSSGYQKCYAAFIAASENQTPPFGGVTVWL